MTDIADDRWASVTGAWPMYRRAESPRPMPQIVRLPYMSFSVANMDAITDQSRVPGFVTIGPIVIVDVSARIRGKITNVSCHSTWESNVHPYPNPAASARFIIATTPVAGGFGCSTTPNSMTPPTLPVTPARHPQGSGVAIPLGPRTRSEYSSFASASY